MTDDDDEFRTKLLERIARLTIAVQSLNPDPTKTIAQHQQDQQRRALEARAAVIIAALSLVLSIVQLILWSSR